MRRAKKGMAMLSVLFAMAVFMLFGTLITTNTLNASVSVKSMVQKTENRNKLGEIGDCFVAEAKKIYNDTASATSDEERAAMLVTALENKFADLGYKYETTVRGDVYALRVFTRGTTADGVTTATTRLVVEVSGGKVAKFSYVG
jgi:L-arabinose isomerase